MRKNTLIFTMTIALIGIALISLVYADEATATLSVSSTDTRNIITVTGTGFNASESVTLQLIANGTIFYTFTETIVTDAEGNFSADVTLPTSTYGTFNLTAATSSVTTYTEYTIEEVEVTLSASPDNSNIISVTGTGFDVSETVLLELVDNDGTVVCTFTETIETDKTGNFSATVIVPTSIHGTYNLTASTATSSIYGYIEYTVPDLTGATGETGATGATGTTGATGEAGESADPTIMYSGIGLSIFAIVLAVYAITKKS